MKKIDLLFLTIISVLGFLVFIGWIDNNQDLFYSGIFGLIGLWMGFLYGGKNEKK